MTLREICAKYPPVPFNRRISPFSSSRTMLRELEASDTLGKAASNTRHDPSCHHCSKPDKKEEKTEKSRGNAENADIEFSMAVRSSAVQDSLGVYMCACAQPPTRLHIFANSYPCTVSMRQWWLCVRCGYGREIGVRGNNNGANVVFRQACVREFSSRRKRARAAGAATATGWLPKLEGWAIGYLGNRRENHSILLAAYHARGESSSQKTLRCILPAGPSSPSPRVSSLSSVLYARRTALRIRCFLSSLDHR